MSAPLVQYRKNRCAKNAYYLSCAPTVTHVVQVEPAFEQSMLYNEMYATSNPVQSELAI